MTEIDAKHARRAARAAAARPVDYAAIRAAEAEAARDDARRDAFRRRLEALEAAIAKEGRAR